MAARGGTAHKCPSLLPALVCTLSPSYSSCCDEVQNQEALISFPFVFVIGSCHWLVIVIVTYISLFSKSARKQITQLYIVLHAQQDCAMHKLVT